VATPFLQRFAHHVLNKLNAEGLVELGPQGAARAADDLAAYLSTTRNSSLIGEVGRGLIRSDAVVELYATDEELKLLVENLGTIAMGE
jgi:hypothetical protein